MRLSMILVLFVLVLLVACGNKVNKPVYRAPYTKEIPIIDAKADEPVWEKAEWDSINYRWLGPAYSKNDFSGRYKACWDESRVYLLFEITDDTLIDIHENPRKDYWDDDCVEVFFDEDASGGNHQYNYNAFAYHVAMDKQVADIGTDSTALLLNDHADVMHRRKGNTSIWEIAFKIYDDTFKPEGDNYPVTLKPGKTMGFAVAYCDNDTSKTRENFIGSVPIAGKDKNRGWIDAGVFGRMKLVRK